MLCHSWVVWICITDHSGHFSLRKRDHHLSFLLKKTVYSINYFLSNLLLDIIVGENDGCVLSTPVISLLVQGCGVMESKEKLDHVLVLDLGRIVDYLQHLDVTSFATTNSVIRWVLLSIRIRTHKADRGSKNCSVRILLCEVSAEELLSSPIASSSESSHSFVILRVMLPPRRIFV